MPSLLKLNGRVGSLSKLVGIVFIYSLILLIVLAILLLLHKNHELIILHQLLRERKQVIKHKTMGCLVMHLRKYIISNFLFSIFF